MLLVVCGDVDVPGIQPMALEERNPYGVDGCDHDIV
jgi:hypothetical protein